jgi:2-polyprenyl-3-methyl-5-hydroxy-6-metoxy-1,4-benzoquinol methylase
VEPRSGETELQPYWDRVSREYAAEDPLAAVCYPGAPTWLNRFFAGLQWQAVTRVLEGVRLGGASALDIGCGFGRWTRWLASHGAEAVGVDPTEGMLQAARGVPGKATDYRRMSATALALPDALFDVVTCITVIQHLEPREQDVAIAELSRVLRPGGTAVLLDLIDLGDRGKIVYPRAARDWISAYAANGLTVVHWEGQEWIPLIRGFRWIAERVGRLLGLGSDQREGPSLLEETRGRGVFRLAFAGLWVLVQLSKPLEPVCRIALPARWARHGCFVLRKADRS